MRVGKNLILYPFCEGRGAFVNRWVLVAISVLFDVELWKVCLPIDLDVFRKILSFDGSLILDGNLHDGRDGACF